MITGMPADLRAVQTSSHRVSVELYARPPASSTWYPLQVVELTLQLGTPEDAPGRAITGTVLLDDATGDNVVSEGYWSPYGTWLYARQIVYRLDGTKIVVPVGHFRLDSYAVDNLTGSITFEANDAFGSQILGYELVTLREAQVKTTETWAARLTALLTEGMRGVPSWWSTFIDWSVAANQTLKPSSNWVSDETSRPALATKMASYMSARVICGAGPSAFKIIWGRSPSGYEAINAANAIHTVKPGSFGNLLADAFDDSIDRRDFGNKMLLTYTLQTNVPGSQVRIQQKRVVTTYDDAGEELAANGPFGVQTREAQSFDVLTDADAQAKALALMGKTWHAARDVSFTCGPLYGIEQGDTIWVLVPGQTGFGGMLTQATIPLHAEGGAWSLTVKTYRQLDTAWKPAYQLIVDETTYDDVVDWIVQKPTGSVALDSGFTTGWSASGNTGKFKGGDSMTATASGSGDLQFATGQQWTVQAEKRYQVRASVSCLTHAHNVRIGINYSPGGVLWSKWTKINKKKTVTLAYDNKAALIPAGAKTFGVTIDVQTPAANSVVRANSVSVEYGARQKPDG